MDDRATLLSLIASHPLAALITPDADDIALTYIPLLARFESDKLLLEGHIARANDQWKHGAIRGVAAFQLAGHYISPTWYPSKQMDPRTVPTYDYVAIEARGPIRFVHDEEWLHSFVRRLSESQEPRVGGTWSVDDAPADYIASQINAIVGVELTVDSLIGTFKLNQNHPEENVASVVASLAALDTMEATTLARFMNEA